MRRYVGQEEVNIPVIPALHYCSSVGGFKRESPPRSAPTDLPDSRAKPPPLAVPTTRDIHHEASSVNVFADIGLPDAEAHLLKAKLALKIDRLMRERGLKQVAAAKLFGMKQPDVCRMLRGDFRQVSVERLMRLLVALGQDVEFIEGDGIAPALRVS